MLSAFVLMALLALLYTRYYPFVFSPSTLRFRVTADHIGHEFPFYRCGSLYDVQGARIVVLCRFNTDTAVPSGDFPLWLDVTTSFTGGTLLLVNGKPLKPPNQGVLIVASEDRAEPIFRTIRETDFPGGPTVVMPSDLDELWAMLGMKTQ